MAAARCCRHGVDPYPATHWAAWGRPRRWGDGASLMRTVPARTNRPGRSAGGRPRRAPAAPVSAARVAAMSAETVAMVQRTVRRADIAAYLDSGDGRW